MRLAVSNIAWQPDEDAQVIHRLGQLGVDAIEVAPTRMFPDPTAVPAAEAARSARSLQDDGLEVVAFQSMLFGRPDLTVFDSAATRSSTREYLARFIELAGAMSASRLVFGSPKNRVVPAEMGASEAFDIAVQFFGDLAVIAEANATVICIEPNPPAYGCNFVMTADQGARLVSAVDGPGFGLHLDAAGMTLAGDDPGTSIRAYGHLLRHFHASAPGLGDLEDTLVDHHAAAHALRSVGYDDIVSIEMRSQQAGTNADRVATAVRLAQRYYGS